MAIKKGNNVARFFNKLISSKDPASSKRFVTLVIALHFIIACFCVLFFSFKVVYSLPRGRVEPELIGLLKDVLEYDFYIILAGLGFITVDNAGSMLLERAKARVQGNIATGSPNVDTLNVQTMTKAETVKAEHVDTVNTQTTSIEKTQD